MLLVARRETAAEPRVEVVEGDARSLPFEDGAFDVAHCSLLVHHLEPAEAVAVLREMRRVARLGVVINDLRRGILPLLATAVGASRSVGSRVTRNDGLASARRAYTLGELDDAPRPRPGSRVRWRSSRAGCRGSYDGAPAA